MAAGIFISYRRDEARHAAGRLADDLAQVFGPTAIFRDIEGIDPGVDFTRSLDKALNACVVMLVLMGPRWLDMRNPKGERRLDDAEDWIRQEIATALKRDVRVVPVLLEGAKVPEASQLPEDLRGLTRRQALDMSDTRWRGDLQRLIEALDKLPGLQRLDQTEPAPPTPEPPTPAPPPKRKGLWLGVAIGAAAVVLAAVLLVEDEVDGPGGYAPPVSLPGADLPNISGPWRSGDGELYYIEQDGPRVDVFAEIEGRDAGDGTGEFDGDMLRVTLDRREFGNFVGTVHCELRAGPELRSFSGACVGPDGPFEAHIFR